MTVVDEAFLACILVVERERQLAVNSSVGKAVQSQGPVSQQQATKSRLLTAMPLSWVDPGEINGEHFT